MTFNSENSNDPSLKGCGTCAFILPDLFYKKEEKEFYVAVCVANCDMPQEEQNNCPKYLNKRYREDMEIMRGVFKVYNHMLEVNKYLQRNPHIKNDPTVIIL
jgi:ferredoxin